MRGKVPDSAKKFTNSRITPAYAGKSYRFFVVACDDWDHPRLCGEKRRHALLSRKGSGSPPPMRGKVVGTVDRILPPGITPAYAGKSYCL